MRYSECDPSTRNPEDVVVSQRRHARAGKSTLAVALVALLSAALLAATGEAAQADQSTGSVDNLRTAWDSAESGGLSPASVQASDFGQVFSAQLDGQVYSQPLPVAGTLVVATENNKVYGLDRETGAINWTRDLGPAWPASALSCADLAPTIGSTSTPVYDAATNAIYLTAKVNDGADVQHPHWYLHAINPGTGTERPGWPVTIAGAPSNDPTVPFDPYYEHQRPALLLMGGVVYAGFGSHCDRQPYRGYVVGVSTTRAAVTAMWAAETGASNMGAGIWQAGGGLISDGPGRILLSTGNGISPAPGPGSAPPGTLSESVVRLQVQADGSLTSADFFSPSDAPTMDMNDTDLGSGAPAALPAGFGTASHPHLLVQQGKDGRVFLLDRDNLGGRKQGANGTDAVVGVTGPYQGQWGHPAVWGGDGGYVYVAGNGGPLRALKYGVTGAGLPALSLAGTSGDSFPYSSGSPIVTSDGTTSGSALVWIVMSSGPTGANATLRAYRPTPDGAGQLALLWSGPIGTASKFVTPTSDGGRVYVGTRDGKVLAFGRPAKTALTASPVEFGYVAVGATGTATALLTATQAVTVNAVGTTAPFGATSPALPRTLTPGQTLQVPVSFTPTAAGGASDVLTVTTNVGTFAVSLHGTGSQPGLAAAPASLAFGSQPTGHTSTLNVQVTNTGTSTETITGSTAPSAPFTASGLPTNGATVPAGGSFVVSVTYAPTAAESDNSSVTVSSTSGTLTIPLTGVGVTGQGHLQLTPPSLDFGSVALGTSSTRSFDIVNTGNLPVTITRAKAPAGDFSAPTPLAEGLVIGPGAVVHQAVVFAPSVGGAQTSDYAVTGDDGQGTLTEPLTGTSPTRLAGGDRFGTSAAISAASFAAGVPVAYVASGYNFPDALSGAPAAGAEKGPVLLTTPDSLPASIANELSRLKPQRIVILGGTAAVSSAVQGQLAQYTTGSVTRLAGSDRFATSAAISAAAFPAGAAVAYVANGTTFPDALSGAPAAASQSGPVLLTSASSIPDSIGNELTRLKPQQIVILGGPNAVSSSVEAQLAQYTTGKVTRLAGPDRFATSAAISSTTFAVGAPVAYVANGMNFPDALSGAPVAGAQGGPVLLTTAGALSTATANELSRLKPKKIVVLGGAGVVSDAVMSQLAQYVAAS